MHLEPGDLVVARTWSWAKEKLQSDAEVSLRDQRAAGVEEPHPSVSTFAMRLQPGEAEEEVMRRLCDYIAGVRPSSKYVTFTTKRRLVEAGFRVQPTPPPDHHHDLILSDVADDQEFQHLVDVLNEQPKRRFPSCVPV